MNPVAVRRVCIPVQPSIPGAETRQTLSILVAVSDPDLRAVTTRVLSNAGHRIVEARHSGHALLACLTGGRIDVLLTELRMEDGSGRALACRLRRHNPDLRCIYLSDDPADRAHDVLVRPVTADNLIDALTGAARQ